MKVESIALLFADSYVDVESDEDETDTSIDETQGMNDSGADEDSDDDAVNRVDVELPNVQEKNNIVLAAIRANKHSYHFVEHIQPIKTTVVIPQPFDCQFYALSISKSDAYGSEQLPSSAYPLNVSEEVYMSDDYYVCLLGYKCNMRAAALRTTTSDKSKRLC